MKYETVRGWKVAASKLMNDLSDDEEADIRGIDLELAVHRVVTHNSSDLSPGSLTTYKSRLTVAIEEFIKWRDNPAGYRPRGLNGKSAAKPSNQQTEKQKQKSQVDGKDQSTERSVQSEENGNFLELSYPLRSDFLAKVIIPRNLTIEEARRLGVFLVTISVDFKPEYFDGK